MVLVTIIRLLKPHPSLAVVKNWKSIVELVLRGVVIVSPRACPRSEHKSCTKSSIKRAEIRMHYSGSLKWI